MLSKTDGRQLFLIVTGLQQSGKTEFIQGLMKLKKSSCVYQFKYENERRSHIADSLFTTLVRVRDVTYVLQIIETRELNQFHKMLFDSKNAKIVQVINSDQPLPAQRSDLVHLTHQTKNSKLKQFVVEDLLDFQHNF